MLTEHAGTLASGGLRVWELPLNSIFEPSGTQHDFNFTFLGIVGMADPVRPGIPEAVSECYDAGIRVIMVTGDYPATAEYFKTGWAD